MTLLYSQVLVIVCTQTPKAILTTKHPEQQTFRHTLQLSDILRFLSQVLSELILEMTIMSHFNKHGMYYFDLYQEFVKVGRDI